MKRIISAYAVVILLVALFSHKHDYYFPGPIEPTLKEISIQEEIHEVWKLIKEAIKLSAPASSDIYKTASLENNRDHVPLDEIEKRIIEWDKFVSNAPKYPEGLFHGKGIVLPAGGKYMTLALVSIKVLRTNGCMLPIEVWYKGSRERPTIRLMEELHLLNVQCYDLDEYFTGHGYATKALAIFASRFQEVLLLDPDSLPVRDVTELFNSKEYLSHGAIFWPDYWEGMDDYSVRPNHPMWKIVRKLPVDLRTQESGQLLVDKRRHWMPLLLSVYFNFHHEYYYKIMDGDKDYFRFSWIALDEPFFMMNYSIGSAGYISNYCIDRKYVNKDCIGYHGHTMVQHGFNGEVLFLHRNLAKWPANAGVDEFMYDAERDRTWTTIQEWKGGKRDVKGTVLLVMARYGVRMVGNVEEKNFLDVIGYDVEKLCYEALKELKHAPYFQEYSQKSDFVCLTC